MIRSRFAGFALAGALMALDGFDIVAMSLAAPHVMPRFGLSPSQMGLVFSALLVGLGLGSMFLGSLGDRFGRRPAMLAGTALLALSTLATASGTSLATFALWRFMAGLALGLCLTNATAMIAELAPIARRASAVALASAGMPLGVVAAGLLAPWLVERGGWELIFGASAAVTAVVCIGMWIWLPESLQRESSRGASSPGARSGLLRLLAPPLRGPVLHFAFLFGLSATAMYAFTNWLPVVLPRAGFPITAAAHYLSLAQGGSLVVGVLIGWLVDKGHGRTAFTICYVAVLVALGAFMAVPEAHWSLLVLMAGGGIAGAHTAIVPMASKDFPSDALSSAIGVGVAMTRIGAVLGSMAGGQLLEAGVSPARFFAAITLPALGCAILVHARPRITPGTS